MSVNKESGTRWSMESPLVRPSTEDCISSWYSDIIYCSRDGRLVQMSREFNFQKLIPNSEWCVCVWLVQSIQMSPCWKSNAVSKKIDLTVPVPSNWCLKSMLQRFSRQLQELWAKLSSENTAPEPASTEVSENFFSNFPRNNSGVYVPKNLMGTSAWDCVWFLKGCVRIYVLVLDRQNKQVGFAFSL